VCHRQLLLVILTHAMGTSFLLGVDWGIGMVKNIVVFSDGTGEQGGVRPDQVLTNVYKLYRASRISGDNVVDPAQQVAFYDPGLGTINDSGVVRLSLLDRFKSFAGLAFGIGITDNIIDCYEFILQNYQPGDRIYLFGFSRGAYTVRSLAGVLRLCGIPKHDADGSRLPTSGPELRRIAEHAVKDVYEFHYGKAQWGYQAKRLEPAAEFRRQYGSGANDENDEKRIFSNAAPYFIGVFETVAALVLSGRRKFLLVVIIFVLSVICGVGVAVMEWLTSLSLKVGLSFFPTLIGATLVIFAASLLYLWKSRWTATSYDKSLDPRVKCARHAMAIDEWRADFQRVPWGRQGDVDAHNMRAKPSDPVWLKQVWFAGDHADIGGGYPETESRLSDIALRWMVSELRSTEEPLILNDTLLNLFPDPAGMQHDEVEGYRERYFGLRIWKKALRKVENGSVLHDSVLRRFACGPVKLFREWGLYRPENLRGVSEVASYYDSAK